jgi:DNA invertase Pin-like site-specific DNA recombinase
MGHLLGYARVSTADQNPELQLDALKAAGCSRIYTDHASGRLDQRPELDKLMERLDAGDVLVVWKLDRLGRSLKHLVAWFEELDRRGVEFRSLTEHIDTTTAQGRFFFHVSAAFAQLSLDLTRERTMAGLQAARERGRRGGRPA